MAYAIVVPRLGWSMEEGTFVRWLKRDGETVRFVVRNDGIDPHELTIGTIAEHAEHRRHMKEMLEQQKKGGHADTFGEKKEEKKIEAAPKPQ